MPLAVGTRVGSCVVVSPLGAGGMGEVYRARDATLGRDVALKVLPGAVVNDPDRLRRFEREARTLGALNHPRIAQIYGLEESSSTGDGQTAFRALVMELVPGESLAARLARGSVPPREALDLARQIAEGLEAAHEKAIVHRDLKPANIQVTPDGAVKVLDFGLAKALAADPAEAAADALTASAGTRAGVVVGTAPYMSPEQARGLTVDARTDIWAFGCVVAEMLSGRRTFPGETTTDVLAAILEREPDWEALPAATPAAVRSLLQRCLKKDPKQRMRDIADARFALEDALAGLSASPTGASGPTAAGGTSRAMAANAPRAVWRHPLPLGLALITLALGAALAWVLGRAPAVEGRSPVYVSVTLPADQELTAQGHAISPDGRRIVYSAASEEGPPGPEGDVTRLFLRDLAERTSRPLPGTEGAGAPFFSPDGDEVAFASLLDLKLKRISLRGGGPTEVADLTGSNFESPGAWTSTGHILFGDRVGPIRRVPAGGGPVEIVVPRTALEAGEMGMTWPVPLPGGSGTLFNARAEFGGIAAYAAGRRRTILDDAAHAQISPTGHLLFSRTTGGQQVDLWAAEFSAGRAELSGAPVAVLSVAGSTRMFYAMSSTGTLVYGAGEPDYRGGRFRWEVLQGRQAPPRLADPPAGVKRVSGPRVSPDGRSVLYHEAAGPGDLRLIVADLGTGARRILAQGQHYWAIWNHDGTRVIYQVPPGEPGGAGIVWRAADGSAPAERLTTSRSWQQPQAVTLDGSALIYQETGGLATSDSTLEDNYDLWLLPLGPPAEPTPLLRTKANEKLPSLSRDQRWMAYVSDETGREEVWVRPFSPGGSASIRVSQSGGTEPVWDPAGRTLYYRDASGMRLFAVPVTLGAVPQFGDAVVRSGRWVGGMPYGRLYDVAPDGSALLLLTQPSAGRELQVIFNFDEVIRRKVAEVGRLRH